MTKFKVGDKVKILDGSKIKNYCSGWLPGHMGKHVGEVYTVESVSKHSCSLKGIAWVWDIRGLELIKEKSHKPIVIYNRDREVIAVDKNTGKKAIAKCCPEDTFNFNIGAKIAFDRLINPQIKKVTRYAKPGEYIKIISPPTSQFDEYELGDILKVVDVGFDGKAFYKHAPLKYANKSEYVVLEGYEPNEVDKESTYNGRIIFTKGDDDFKTGHIYEIKNGYIKLNSREYPISGPFKDIDDVKDFFTADAKGHNGHGWSNETLELIEVQDD